MPDLGGRDQGGGGGGGVAVPLGRGRRHLAAEVDHLPEHAPWGDPLRNTVLFVTEIFSLYLHLGEMLQPPVLVTGAGLQTQPPEVGHLEHLNIVIINMNTIMIAIPEQLCRGQRRRDASTLERGRDSIPSPRDDG